MRRGSPACGRGTVQDFNQHGDCAAKLNLYRIVLDEFKHLTGKVTVSFGQVLAGYCTCRASGGVYGVNRNSTNYCA